ncbi:MAG: radical SAM protein [Deltaproteobacteria bacterium]|nr:radical SAM protein [Deltaproteobacteria bacterium]
MTKLQPVERHIDAVIKDLLQPLLGPRPRSEWKLVSWDAEQGICLTFQRADSHILIEMEERNDESDCYARTKKFNVCARRQFEVLKEMTADDRHMVDAVVELVGQREDRLEVFERPTASRKRAVREILVDRVLIPEGKGQYYINPYVGCMIGCPFCYVIDRADLSRKLEGLPYLPWGQFVDVKVNAPEVLKREVTEYPPGVVRMSPILTDPYQSIERSYRITRKCLEVLLEAGFSPVVLTRAARIVEDLDLLKRFPKILVGFSIPTNDDKYRQIFEPGADPIDDRIGALEACCSAGLRTVVFIQPMLPMNVEALVQRVAPLVHAVRIDRMYCMNRVRNLYEEHDLAEAATDTFFEETSKSLRKSFEAHGVNIDEMDELYSLLE